MKNTLVKSKAPGLRQSNTRDAAASLKIVVFEMGNLKLALRIESVYKVLNHIRSMVVESMVWELLM
jgi:hypothetical protein